MWQKWIDSLKIKFDNLKQETEYDKGYRQAMIDVLSGMDDISPWRAKIISPRYKS